MNYSAILLVAKPGALNAAIEQAAQVPGVDVHQIHPKGERAVCTIEAATVDDEVRIFSSLRDLEAVFDVSLLEHRPGADE